MSFELPSRQGRSKRPVPAISIGARRRGAAKRLTPYILFTKEAAEMLFGNAAGHGVKLALKVGTDQDAGWVTLDASPAGTNVSLRRQSKVNEDLVVESALIPHDGKTQLRRTEAEIEFEDNVLKVKLPWALDKSKRTSKKASL